MKNLCILCDLLRLCVKTTYHSGALGERALNLSTLQHLTYSFMQSFSNRIYYIPCRLSNCIYETLLRVSYPFRYVKSVNGLGNFTVCMTTAASLPGICLSSSRRPCAAIRLSCSRTAKPRAKSALRNVQADRPPDQCAHAVSLQGLSGPSPPGNAVRPAVGYIPSPR